MKSPRRVIIYSKGLQGFNVRKYHDEQNQKARAAAGGVPCERCGRVYKNPDRAHYSDPKNRTPCF